MTGYDDPSTRDAARSPWRRGEPERMDFKDEAELFAKTMNETHRRMQQKPPERRENVLDGVIIILTLMVSSWVFGAVVGFFLGRAK